MSNSGEIMTNEEALKELKGRVYCAEYIDDGWVDDVPIAALKTAIDALSKQIARKVRYEWRCDGGNLVDDVAYCPSCGFCYEDIFNWECGFCTNCGQKLDWEAADE